MPVSIVKGKEAKELAEKYSPVIHQEWQDLRDFYTPLMLQDLPPAAIPVYLMEGMKEPTLYYAIREDDDYYYCFYMPYHPFDWSNSPIGIIRRLDSHRHDTEAILFRVSKSSSGFIKRSERIDACTVCHYSFKFMKNSDRKIYSEPEGHGLKPLKEKHLKGKKNFAVYSKFTFVDMAAWPVERWEALRKALGNASMPDEQADNTIMGSLGRSHGDYRAERGDIWNRPDKLFLQAEVMSKL